MSRIEREVVVHAPLADVWDVLADLESVAEWSPTVQSVSCGERAQGVGATRVCDMGSEGQIDEVVSRWEPPHELWFAVGGHGAIRSAEMGYVLEPAPVDGTLVRAVADYHLALGPIGPVIDALTIRRLMSRMLASSLGGLKRHIEAHGAAAGRSP